MAAATGLALVATTGLALVATWPGAGGAADGPARRPPAGLMAHLRLDGALTEARGLRAVRPEAIGRPRFVDGVRGQGIVPAAGRAHAVRLVVTTLSRLLLGGRTPATGTFMVWYRDAPAPAPPPPRPLAPDDSARGTTLFRSDAPLSLELAVRAAPPGVTAVFADASGEQHRLDVELASAAPGAGEWQHVALAWDAGAGVVELLVGGRIVAAETGPPFETAGLPKVIEVGAPGVAVDEFRLYRQRLDPAAVRSLPGF